ncbi:uncharacterized protein C1orf112 homolog [Zootermopsis nevadensis]|uniref:Uncharacterized protein n=1 Tax=Zootermopsis nevadensis TaxID=136037 RepID=A0A067R9Z9_ZOONE|nr:uncharacterized protein C1orf112 homolog [Zootermopsis nevadensis]KDR20530.1 hypothetical protein L798_04980 [Zootermopsis nevadensis]
MSSKNESFFDLIAKLSEWSTQDVEENLADTLPVLLRILECPDQKALSLQALQALLNKCLPCIPVNDVEEKLFQYVLPSARQLFLEALQGIHVMLQDVQSLQQDELLDSLSSLLQVCIEILKCIDNTLHYIQAVGKVQVTLVPSLTKVTVSVLFEAFKHCKESEKMYGTLFQALSEVLTLLFQKSRELQLHFLEVVSGDLQFECMYENDLMLLTEILDMLGQIGQLVVDLDVKTMAEQWKGYTRLAFQYVEHLKPRLDVTGPLQFLAMNISDSIATVVETDPPDMKAVTRAAKVGNFMLKIIIKFCDEYSGFLGSCHQELFQMLLTLHRYSRPYLQLKTVPEDLIQSVETYVTIGAEPLLTHLIAEVEFTEKFMAYGNKLVEPQSERLAFLLLSVSILKKLLHCNEDVRKLWFCCDSEDNILFVLFRALDHCHAEMSWDVQMPGIRHDGGPERMTDLYETIVTHASGLVLSASGQEFLSVEQILLESVLQSTVWRALLAMDIWCIVARSGSSELCFQQLCHLAEVMRQLAHHRGHPERTYLMAMADRLFSFLPNKHKMQIVEMFPPQTDPFLWQALSVKVLPEKLRASVTESLMRSAISHLENFFTLPASIERYNSMVDTLAAASQCVEMLNPSQRDMLLAVTGHVVTLWQHVVLNETLAAEETSVKGSQWMEHFVCVLCSVSAPLAPHMTNLQLIKVLERLNNVCTCGSSVLRLKVVTVLKRLANLVVEPTPDQIKVFQLIAGLFSTLLQDENHLVQQMTLEVFTYFAHVNSHESILALSVKKSVNLQQKTRRYLQKLPTKEPDKNFLSYESYIKRQSQAQFSHRCTSSVQAHEDVANSKLTSRTEFRASDEGDTGNRLPKRPKLMIAEDSVIKVIERLKNDASTVVKYCEDNSLPAETKQDILQIALQLKSLSLR